ncbi:MAG TPA: hypothetical protein VIL69_24360, partial [Roseomonas sp.]
MRRDPLAVLARLRSAEVMQARRHLAEEAVEREAATAQERAATDALLAEALRGGPAHAAWLPRGLAIREAASGEARLAATRAEEAAAALGVARAA